MTLHMNFDLRSDLLLGSVEISAIEVFSMLLTMLHG
jgi:hypothetical protein